VPSRPGLANLVVVRSWCGAILLVMLASGCAAQRPPRYVIENDVAGYHYRRYQKVADIEVPIPENPAVGHTATYVRAGEPVQVLPVFVTSYERGPGLAESVRQRLRAMDEYVWQMRGESGDVWLLWISGKELVKIGAPSGEPQVPADVANAYLAVYPSDLNRRGRVKSGADSAGPAMALGGVPQPDDDSDTN
jgi:hypothetical protein